MRRVSAAGLALALAGCAQLEERLDRLEARWSKSENDELAAATAGRAPQAPVDCVETRAGLRLVGGALVAQDGARLWVNDNDRACAGAGLDPLIVTEPMTGSRLCRNDRFRAIPRGSSIAGLTCRIGVWTPYLRPQ